MPKVGYLLCKATTSLGLPCQARAHEGTPHCRRHGGLVWYRQCANDRRRLEAAAAAYLNWLACLERDWIARGQSPATFHALALEGRAQEVEDWLLHTELLGLDQEVP